MMREAQAVAHKLGIEFRVSLENASRELRRLGKHKPSMLKDVEAGRALEIDALVGAVVELARLTDTPTPHIDTVYSWSCCSRELIAAAGWPGASAREARVRHGGAASGSIAASRPNVQMKMQRCAS